MEADYGQLAGREPQTQAGQGWQAVLAAPRLPGRPAPPRRCPAQCGAPSPLLSSACAGYIGEFEFVDNHRSGKIVVELNGRLNKCGVISPRYDISQGDIEAWVGRLLPSRQFGHIILTTSQGIMDHEEARCARAHAPVGGESRCAPL